MQIKYTHTKYLVIGVNAAGFYALESIRKNDPAGSITAVNGEKYLPYKRTTVNKHFFPDGLDIGSFMLVDPDWYEANKITILNNTIVTSLDSNAKTATLSSGRCITWEKLLISTGADSFCPFSTILSSALSIRTYDNALEVRELIKSTRSCLIYGLGIEAVETAAQLCQAGLKVTIAGRGGSLLNRYFSEPVVQRIEKLFAEHSVPVLYNISADDVHAVDSAVSIKGSTLMYDFLLYSTGILPRADLAQECGIKTDRGILVNSQMETSLPDIYAAGDCTRLNLKTISGFGLPITDNWHSAQDQGRIAGSNMSGISASWPVRKYRVKTELFGKYFFSMRPFKENTSDGLPDDRIQDLSSEESILPSGAYRLFHYKENRLLGVEMAGDKPRAKLYEQAVNQEWDKSRVEKELF